MFCLSSNAWLTILISVMSDVGDLHFSVTFETFVQAWYNTLVDSHKAFIYPLCRKKSNYMFTNRLFHFWYARRDKGLNSDKCPGKVGLRYVSMSFSNVAIRTV